MKELDLEPFMVAIFWITLIGLLVTAATAIFEK